MTFSFENLSLSLIGHGSAMMIALIFALAMPPPTVIAPDRIKIVEINLKDVKIEGLETKLKNQDAKRGADDAKKTSAADKKTDAKRPEPIIKTIKVNREVHALDRTLTISVIDALRVSMTRCWQIDSTRQDLAEIRAVAHIKLYPNGRVQSFWFEQQSRANTDPTYAYVFETIRLAIDACNPFSMLPRGEYDKWKSVQLTFYPTAKVVE